MRDSLDALRRRLEWLLGLDAPLFPPVPPPARRTAVIAGAVAIGVLAGIATWLLPNPITLGGVGVGDIGPPVIGAKLFLDGTSPYQVRLQVVNITLYPFTTSLALAPLLMLPHALWAPLFAAVVGGLLGLAVLWRGEPWRLLMLASIPFWSALLSVQWSPVFAAALLLPALLPVAVVKPQLGLALLFGGRWRLRHVLVAATVVVVSIAILPRWPLLWLRQGHLGDYEGRSPVLVGAGILLLSCVFLWRNARSRLLLVMSIIAQRYFYDQLLLFVIPRNPAQMVVLLSMSWAGALTCYVLGWWVPVAGQQDLRVWHVMVATTYLPCLAMVWWDARSGSADARPVQ